MSEQEISFTNLNAGDTNPIVGQKDTFIEEVKLKSSNNINDDVLSTYKELTQKYKKMTDELIEKNTDLTKKLEMAAKFMGLRYNFTIQDISELTQKRFNDHIKEEVIKQEFNIKFLAMVVVAIWVFVVFIKK
jgi:hypothetical protein